MQVTLNQAEIAILDQQDQGTSDKGGYQQLMVRLQNKLNRTTGVLDLDDADLEKIPRYALDYRDGGWEDRLKAVFGRTLGSNLGR